MQVKVLAAVAALVVACLLAACGKTQSAVSTGTLGHTDGNLVLIGHAAPLSGPLAHLGRDNENGARLAIEELNAQGVFIGADKVRLQLQSEDDAGDPVQAAVVAQKLVESKVAGVVGHMNSGATIAASRIYVAAGIPQISPSATNPEYTRQAFKTAFRVLADDTQLGRTLGKYAVGSLMAKTVAVVDDRTDYGRGVAEEFAKAVVAAGAKIVSKYSTSDKATDFGPILAGIRRKRPDIVFFGGMDAVAGPMLRQMKSLTIPSRFMGGDGICTADLAKLAGNAVADDKVFCAEAGGVEGDARAGLDQFKNRYRARFNNDIELYAPYAYDAVNLMVAAMVKAGSTDPAKYLPVLAATSGYQGITGTIAFDLKGDVRNGAVTIKTLRGGKFVSLAVLH